MSDAEPALPYAFSTGAQSAGGSLPPWIEAEWLDDEEALIEALRRDGARALLVVPGEDPEAELAGLLALLADRSVERPPLVVLTSANEQELALRLISEGADFCVDASAPGAAHGKSSLARALERACLAHGRRVRAAEREERLRHFVGFAAHDLRAPLRTIRSYASLLAEELGPAPPGAAASHLAALERGAARMARLIERLLEYSRLDHIEATQESVDLEEVLDAAIDVLGDQLSGARLLAGDLPKVRGDRHLLTQLVVNVLGNAAKYAGLRGPASIRVEAQRSQGLLELRFSDDGPGIPAEYREQVFEPFERLHTQDQVPGSGLGLAICRRIAEHHGGTIAVGEASGGGALVTVRLPLARPS